MARATGLEPATSAVTGRRSNQLSYARALIEMGVHSQKKRPYVNNLQAAFEIISSKARQIAFKQGQAQDAPRRNLRKQPKQRIPA